MKKKNVTVIKKANVKILIVDDEPELRELYVCELKEYASFVISAKDGVDALQLLEKEGDIEVLVTDLRMPNMDGLELLEKVSSLYPHIITLIVTANRDYDSMSKAIGFGVYDFLDKPLQMDIYDHKIKKAIDLVIRNRKRNQLLEYLLTEFSDRSLEEFHQLDISAQEKILNGVQQLITVKLLKNEVKRVG